MLNRIRSVALGSIARSIVALALSSPTAQAGLYVGSRSTEANYSFAAQVETERATKPTEAQAQELIDRQLQHLFGPWTGTREKAVPKQNHKIEITSIERTEAGRYTISYRYAGTIVLEQKPGATAGDRGTFDAYLPVNPDTVFEAGLVGDHNPCTDSHYQAEGDFWYFWSPLNPGCRLQEGRDYLRVAGQFVRFPNTRVTYPEYHRLADPKTGKIEIVMLFGMDDPEAADTNPALSRDVNAPNYRDILRGLEQLGFNSSRLTSAQKRKLFHEDERALAESFTIDRLTKKTPKGTIEVLMYFGATGIDEKSRAFHLLYKRALEKSSVMFYNGHSGLGGHLDIPSIENLEGIDISLPRDRYQILFFNSCSSYSYYNREYFKRKRSSTDPIGTKNLDIFANGLATYFHVMHDTDMVLLRAIDAWATQNKWMSYQEMAREIDSDNLFGINGDEDNPVLPIQN